jgi:hypothetical protein
VETRRYTSAYSASDTRNATATSSKTLHHRRPVEPCILGTGAELAEGLGEFVGGHPAEVHMRDRMSKLPDAVPVSPKQAHVWAQSLLGDLTYENALDVALSTRPCRHSRPSSQNTTSAKVRWMSMPITRFMRLPSVNGLGSGWAARQLRIRARGATGRVAGAASY